jgi:hypothetical protein
LTRGPWSYIEPWDIDSIPVDIRPGRRIVSAELCLEGERFEARVNADMHIRQWYDKMFPGGRKHISNYSGEELLTLIGPAVEEPKCMDWRGVELFLGRKPEGKTS